jgi:hypothetical protein
VKIPATISMTWTGGISLYDLHADDVKTYQAETRASESERARRLKTILSSFNKIKSYEYIISRLLERKKQTGKWKNYKKVKLILNSTKKV